MITPTLNENYQVFTDDFFTPYKSKQTNYKLELNESISKTFKFPTLFKGTENGMAIFLCSYNKLKKHLPHSSMNPVRMPGNRAVFAISCYKYTHIQEMQPYNEISFTVPVVFSGAWNIPFVTMATKGLYKNFGYYVFSMPVNSVENNIRGNKIWGLPKFVTQIEVKSENGMFYTKVYDDKTPYVDIKFPIAGSKKNMHEKLAILSVKENQLLGANVTYRGEFLVNTSLGVAFRKEKKDNAVLRIGDTPRGNLLKGIELETVPFQTRYSNNVLSALHLPEPFNY